MKKIFYRVRIKFTPEEQEELERKEKAFVYAYGMSPDYDIINIRRGRYSVVIQNAKFPTIHLDSSVVRAIFAALENAIHSMKYE